ncbi:MAG: Gfo/Idh/MocA family protein [Desulfobacteraceae bacterium]
MAGVGLKLGVVGVGHLGRYHVQKYAAMDEAELVGVMDSDRSRAEDIGRRYGVKVFGGMEELLSEVDAVSLAVPTGLHYDLALRILQSGVHLLVEKPITYSVEHAEHLVAEARKRGLVLQVGHVERFSPPVMEMTSMVRRPLFIEAHRMNLFTPRGTDVDVVLDLMIHDLDIILNAVACPIKGIQAVGMRVVTGSTDIANARMVFENGTVATLTASRVSDKTLRKIRVFQDDACLSVDCARRELSITRLEASETGRGGFPGVATNKLTYPESDPLADQLASFVRAVRSGGEPEVSGEDGLRALEAALRIIQQIREGGKDFQSFL